MCNIFGHNWVPIWRYVLSRVQHTCLTCSPLPMTSRFPFLTFCPTWWLQLLYEVYYGHRNTTLTHERSDSVAITQDLLDIASMSSSSSHLTLTTMFDILSFDPYIYVRAPLVWTLHLCSSSSGLTLTSMFELLSFDPYIYVRAPLVWP